MVEEIAHETRNHNDGTQTDAAKEMAREASTEALREAVL